MRTIGAGLAALLASGDAMLAKLAHVVRADGTVIRMTTLDETISLDLGEGDEDYSAGMTLTAIASGEGLEAGTCELTGPFSDDITQAAVLGGLFDGARIRLLVTSPEATGHAALLGGYVAEARIAGDTFVFEIRDHRDRLNQPIGRVLSPYCSADFCDAQCGLDIADFTTAATVAAVTDAMRLTVTYAGGIPDNDLNQGTVLFTSGALAGIELEIFDWATGGDLQLFEPLPALPEIGDELDLRFGCLKIRKSDDAAARTCMFYENIANMRAFTEVPGSDQALKYPNPGSAGG